MVIHGLIVRNRFFYLSGVLIKQIMARLLQFCLELHKNDLLLTIFIDDLFNEKHHNMELKTVISDVFA